MFDRNLSRVTRDRRVKTAIVQTGEFRSELEVVDVRDAWGLLMIGLFGLITSSVFLGMVLIGAVRFRRNALREDVRLRERPEFLPAISLFKPLHGDELGLEANLRTFFEQDYLRHVAATGGDTKKNGVSRVEMLFCARTGTDEGLEIARRVAAEYPDVTARFVTSGAPWAANAKVCSLAAMAKVASHDLWAISDSDVRVTPDYLRRIVMPFADEQVGCATCLYRGVVIKGGFWSQLEAVGMTIEMSSGICADSLIEPVKFALGPTMVTRRARVEEIGGFESIAEYCADDFVLGNWIAKNGHKVVLSGHAIDHMVLQGGFVDSIKHQVRWMKSTRFSRPRGHLGYRPYLRRAVWGDGVGWCVDAGDAGAGMVCTAGQCAGAKPAGLGGRQVCGSGEEDRAGDDVVSAARSAWSDDLAAELCEQKDSVAWRGV